MFRFPIKGHKKLEKKDEFRLSPKEKKKLEKCIQYFVECKRVCVQNGTVNIDQSFSRCNASLCQCVKDFGKELKTE